uniref:Small ribosomal subunit protein mS38 n=1 Tax=Oryctolagus cuniculus TaxID=9986 RepID=G1TFB1_RABIT
MRTLKTGRRHAGLSSWPSWLPLKGRGSCCPTPCSLKCWLCPEPSCACAAARPWAAAEAPTEVLRGPGVAAWLSPWHLGGRLPGRTSEQWPQGPGGQRWDHCPGIGCRAAAAGPGECQEERGSPGKGRRSPCHGPGRHGTRERGSTRREHNTGGPPQGPWAGRGRPWPVSGVLGSHACRPRYGTQPAGPRSAASAPGRGARLELEEMLVPRRLAISPLESWLAARCLLPRPDAGAPGAEAPAQQPGEGPAQGDAGARGAAPVCCKNVLKIRRRKMNRHKHRKLVRRTRFLRRSVREGRLKRKQVRFERDLQRIWLKAGLKEAPEGWQTPRIYGKSK